MTTDGLLSVTNWVYLLSLFIAAVASVGLWRLSIASGEEKDRQLEQYKTDKASELERYKADANKQIAGANATAAAAKADAAKANEAAAKLQVRAGQFEKDAAEARERTARIERATAWRVLTPQMIDILVIKLSEIDGGPIQLSYAVGDPEALSYAIQIAHLFSQVNFFTKMDKWQVEMLPRIFSSTVYFDLRIYGPNKNVVDPVSLAFSGAGIAYSTIAASNNLIDLPNLNSPGSPPTNVAIFVGSRQPM